MNQSTMRMNQSMNHHQIEMRFPRNRPHTPLIWIHGVCDDDGDVCDVDAYVDFCDAYELFASSSMDELMFLSQYRHSYSGLMSSFFVSVSVFHCQIGVEKEQSLARLEWDQSGEEIVLGHD